MSKTIHDIPEADRPREKLLRKGAAALSDQELLAVLLGKGTTKIDVMALARNVTTVADKKGLGLTVEDLVSLEGMGTTKAMLLVAAIEFARRRIKPEGAKIVTPADLLPHVRHYADRKQEHFLCASINGANEILNIRVVSIGLIDRSPVHPREVFADALSDRASAVTAMGDDKLKLIAAELITQVKTSVTIDWTLRESARAKIKVMVKRILNKHGYPPDLQEEAVKTVLAQAELLCAEWV